MKHLLIILSLILLSSLLTSCEKKDETLYRWETSSGWEWKTTGDKETHSVYKGDVENGVPNGQGTLTSPDGWKHVAEWKDGLVNGQGTFTFPDGTKYVGEVKNGKYNGQGTRTWSNGNKYVGEFKDGKQHGQGTHTYGKGKWEGDKSVGEWKDGNPWNTTEYDKNGNIVGKYVNGK